MYRVARLLCTFVCALPLLAVAPGTGNAAPAKTSIPALASAMQERYAQLQSFRAGFTQKLTHQESGATETRTGTLMFQRPLRIRWETATPDPELLVISEKEIWNYLPEEKTASRYEPGLARDSRTIIQVITGQSRLDQDFSVQETGREGNLVVLALYPNDPTMQFTEGKLWIDPASKFIQRAAITDFYGNVNDITLRDMAVNLSFSPDTFSFTPPAGVTVEDRMDADTAGTPLLR